MRLKNREDNQNNTNWGTYIILWRIADAEHFFPTPQDNEEAEYRKTSISERKTEAKKKAVRQCVNQGDDSLRASVTELIKVRPRQSTPTQFNTITHDAGIRAEQDALTKYLKNLKLQATRPELQRSRNNDLCTSQALYKANESRIESHSGILVRKYYNETGHIKHYQILLPKHLVSEMLKHLHGDFGRHSGFTANTSSKAVGFRTAI